MYGIFTTGTRYFSTESCLGDVQHTSVLDNDPGDSHSSIGSHLDGPQSTSLVTLLAQFRGSIYDDSMSADLNAVARHPIG
jgi:hypothetical protein